MDYLIFRTGEHSDIYLCIVLRRAFSVRLNSNSKNLMIQFDTIIKNSWSNFITLFWNIETIFLWKKNRIPPNFRRQLFRKNYLVIKNYDDLILKVSCVFTCMCEKEQIYWFDSCFLTADYFIRCIIFKSLLPSWWYSENFFKWFI